LTCEKIHSANETPDPSKNIFTPLEEMASEEHTNPNWHYLQFIGSLLSEATRCYNNSGVNYQWFEDLLNQFNIKQTE
jgi:hypothetical protein